MKLRWVPSELNSELKQQVDCNCLIELILFLFLFFQAGLRRCLCPFVSLMRRCEIVGSSQITCVNFIDNAKGTGTQELV